MKTINDKKLDKILADYHDDNKAWDWYKINVGKVPYVRESIILPPSNKITAKSLISKEPYFFYSFMEDIYALAEDSGDDPNAITYARPTYAGSYNHAYRYEVDIYSAHPHILKYERLPIDGTLYRQPDPTKLNFYRNIDNEAIGKNSIVTDELYEYLGGKGFKYLFTTDFITGSLMGDKLCEKAYQSKKSKAEIKNVHYGYYQKKYIDYDNKEDCYVRDPRRCHELLMVAVFSHLCLIMLQLREAVGIYNGITVTDAYKWDSEEIDIEAIKKFFAEKYPNYNYRIKDYYKGYEDGVTDHIIYKSYPDLPDKKYNKGVYKKYK